MNTERGDRKDLNILQQRRVDLSPKAQKIVDKIKNSIATDKFKADHSYIIDSPQLIAALSLGLEYPDLEGDFSKNGQKFLIIRIPLLRQEMNEGRQAILDFRNGRGEKMGELLFSLEAYREIAIVSLNTMLSDLQFEDISYIGMLSTLRYEGGGLVIPKEYVPIIAPTVAEISLAFELHSNSDLSKSSLLPLGGANLLEYPHS